MSENGNIEMNAGVQYGIQMLEQMPKGDRIAMEEHITGVLVVFWGALWGSFGTEYARGFIESQLRGMEPDVPNERYVQATVQ
jgi:hypothetical protein